MNVSTRILDEYVVEEPKLNFSELNFCGMGNSISSQFVATNVYATSDPSNITHFRV